MKKLLPILVVWLLVACSYSVYMTRYPHLKTVRVTTFENRSTQYTVQEELLSDLVSQIQRDGQLKVVEQAPDCVLEGVILDYKNSVYDYTATDVVTQYKVQMLFSVTLTDLVKNEELWHNESLLLEQAYSTTSSQSGLPATEEGAREEIYEDLYNTLMENTFESW